MTESTNAEAARLEQDRLEKGKKANNAKRNLRETELGHHVFYTEAQLNHGF